MDMMMTDNIPSTFKLNIPTIDPTTIHTYQLDALIKIGFCYIQLPSNDVILKLKSCMQVAREFFQRSPEEKSKWHVKETSSSNERHEGYAKRSQNGFTNEVEQLFFEPDTPLSLFIDYVPLIKEMNEFFMNHISLPLMHGIFTRLNISDANFREAFCDAYRSFVFLSYPPILTTEQDNIRLNAHKDFGLLTMLFTEESGLQVKYQDNWLPISAKENCIIVNVGNALEHMTGGQCHSALHRVINAPDYRMSSTFFVNPNYQRKVWNYVDKKLVAPTGEIFFKQQFRDYYHVEQ